MTERLYFLIFPFVAAWLASLLGCTGAANPSTSQSQAAVESQKAEVSRRLFENAVDQMNRLSDYGDGQLESAIEQMVRRLNESLEAGALDGRESEPFNADDGKVLREFVWLRETAEFAVGDAADPIERSNRLFDWTIRNIQLIDDAPPPSADKVDERLPYLPWITMALGRGTALDRAWMFALLARQQGLDVVLLMPADARAAAAAMQAWPALEHEGRLHLYDATWGTAIPGPGGQGIATLDEVQNDDALLRKLDLDQVGGPKHPLTSSDAKKLTVYIETSAPFLSPKFARLERLLSGDSKMVLSIDRDELFERVKKCKGVERVEAWPLREQRFEAGRKKAEYDALVALLAPFRAPPIAEGAQLRRPPLWEARVKHITGNYYDPLSGKQRIARIYQESRPPESQLKDLAQNRALWSFAHRIKQNATYWLGLVSFDLGNYDTAVEYFQLVLKEPANGGWTTGARYNLGRTLEALEEPTKAADAYRATFLGVKPDAACLYRAKQL